MLKQKIKDLASNYKDEFINIRRHLHAYPELSYQEFETSQYVQQRLKEYDIPFEIKANTGIAGLIKGKNPECGGKQKGIAKIPVSGRLPK